MRDSNLREDVGITVLGTWERGAFEPAAPDTRLEAGTILVLAGSAQQVDDYNQRFCPRQPSREPVVIIGGGRVGRAAGEALASRGMDYRIVETQPQRIRDPRSTSRGMRRNWMCSSPPASMKRRQCW